MDGPLYLSIVLKAVSPSSGACGALVPPEYLSAREHYNGVGGKLHLLPEHQLVSVILIIATGSFQIPCDTMFHQLRTLSGPRRVEAHEISSPLSRNSLKKWGSMKWRSMSARKIRRKFVRFVLLPLCSVSRLATKPCLSSSCTIEPREAEEGVDACRKIRLVTVFKMLGVLESLSFVWPSPSLRHHHQTWIHHELWTRIPQFRLWYGSSSADNVGTIVSVVALILCVAAFHFAHMQIFHPEVFP